VVTYIYNVSQSGNYTTIQHAINNIQSELVLETPTQDIVINVDDGAYPGFRIPDGALFPLMGTVFRLIIRSAGNFFPIIDFNESTEDYYVGADIGTSNPNVTIEKLRFQFFAVGVRASLNCHNLKISKCIVANNRNCGILVDQCDNIQVLQNIVTNGDFGIVTRLCKNIALIHNSVFLNGSISTTVGKATSAIWCQLAKDYGRSEKGKLYLVGNIAWNLIGSTLSLFIDDVESVDTVYSNYNDFVVGNKDKFISLEDSSFYAGANAKPRRYYKTLSEWKPLGYDSNSISEDPKFFVPLKVSSSTRKNAIDLNLLTISPCLGKVPNFSRNTAAAALWLPSYVDSADLDTDILGNSRSQYLTAIGANEKESNSGFFGQDILSIPIEDLTASSCGVDPLFDVIQRKLDLWYPKYKAGYFYSYDRSFYLYSRKKCVTLGYLSRTEFILPSRVDIHKPVVLKVNGLDVTNPNYYDVISNTFVLYHLNLPINSLNEEIEISYSVSSWSDNGFISTPTYVRFKISEGKTRFFLESDYVAKGPVVITDDFASPTDKDLYSNKEFSIDWDYDVQRAEIKFAQNSNKVINSQFDYSQSGIYPLYWSTTGSSITTGTHLLYPVCGSFMCSLEHNGYIEQQLPAHSGEATLSFYAARTGDSSRVSYALSFYDSFNRDLGYVVTGSLDPGLTWNRYYVTLGTTGSTINQTSPDDYPHAYLQHFPVPENASKMLARFTSSGLSMLDAVQYEYASTPSSYHRRNLLGEFTVEYETSDDEYFVDYNRAMASSMSTVNDGFLYIPEIPASAYGGPISPSITTFYEWRWRDGRTNYIPWARLYGKDKLRFRTIFHQYPQPRPPVSTPVLFTPSVKAIDIIPSAPIVLQGSEDPVQINVVITDEDNNPFTNASCNLIVSDYQGEYPGLLHKKLYGTKEQLGQAIYGKTNSAGSVVTYWLPPDKVDCLISTTTPIPSSFSENGQKMSYIKTKYPVNLDYFGNVIILDESGNKLPVNSTVVEKNVFSTTKKGTYVVVKLAYPAVPGSVVVSIDGTEFIETQNANPESNQFFVDYENSVVTINSSALQVYIEYLPSYVFVNRANQNVIVIYHDKVFGSYTGAITVGYDFVVTLTVKVTDYSEPSLKSKTFDLIAANCLTSETDPDSTTYLDI